MNKLTYPLYPLLVKVEQKTSFITSEAFGYTFTKGVKYIKKIDDKKLFK